MLVLAAAIALTQTQSVPELKIDKNRYPRVIGWAGEDRVLYRAAGTKPKTIDVYEVEVPSMKERLLHTLEERNVPIGTMQDGSLLLSADYTLKSDGTQGGGRPYFDRCEGSTFIRVRWDYLTVAGELGTVVSQRVSEGFVATATKQFAYVLDAKTRDNLALSTYGIYGRKLLRRVELRIGKDILRTPLSVRSVAALNDKQVAVLIVVGTRKISEPHAMEPVTLAIFNPETGEGKAIWQTTWRIPEYPFDEPAATYVLASSPAGKRLAVMQENVLRIIGIPD